MYKDLAKKYPIVSIEDPFDQVGTPQAATHMHLLAVRPVVH
jgi:enolase